MEMDWEEKYYELLQDYRMFKKGYEELREKYNKADSDLSSANFKIRTELEPRIQREKRGYDNWITSSRCNDCDD